MVAGCFNMLPEPMGDTCKDRSGGVALLLKEALLHKAATEACESMKK